MNYLFVFLGGGLGSLARFLTSKAASRWIESDFPFGTFLANMLACIMLALLVVFISDKQEQYSWIQPMLIIGFCGGFSTFSTFSNETFTLLNNGQLGWAIANIALSVAIGVALIFFLRTKLS